MEIFIPALEVKASYKRRAGASPDGDATDPSRDKRGHGVSSVCVSKCAKKTPLQKIKAKIFADYSFPLAF
jgi:hypothetical protein